MDNKLDNNKGLKNKEKKHYTKLMFISLAFVGVILVVIVVLAVIRLTTPDANEHKTSTTYDDVEYYDENFNDEENYYEDSDEFEYEENFYDFPEYIEIPQDYSELTEDEATYIVNTKGDANLSLFYAPRKPIDGVVRGTGAAENGTDVTVYGTSGEFTLIYSEDVEDYGWVASKYLLKAPDYEYKGTSLIVAVGGDDVLPLRQGPDKSYEEIGEAENEATVVVIGKCEDVENWVLVYSERNITSGWVNGDFLIAPEDTDVYYIADVKGGDVLPLRIGGGTYYEKILDISHGKTVKLIGKSYTNEKWWYVHYQDSDKYGWVNSDYLTTEEEMAASDVTQPSTDPTTIPPTTIAPDVYISGGSSGGSSLQFTANGNVSNPSYVWNSSNNSVATVNNGVVTPVGEGTAVITVTMNGVCSDSKTVSVGINWGSEYTTTSKENEGPLKKQTASYTEWKYYRVVCGSCGYHDWYGQTNTSTPNGRCKDIYGCSCNGYFTEWQTDHWSTRDPASQAPCKAYPAAKSFIDSEKREWYWYPSFAGDLNGSRTVYTYKQGSYTITIL